MRQPLTSHFGLNPGIECELNPDNRVVLWVPGVRESGFQNWERISSLAGKEAEEDHGVCTVGAMSVPLKQPLPNWFGKVMRRFKPIPEGSWITPLGEPAEAVGPKRTDLLLVWSNSTNVTLDQQLIDTHWPDAMDCRPLGSNLLLVGGIEAIATPCQVNKARFEEKRQNSGEDYLAELKNDLHKQAERVLAAARESGDSAKEALALTDLGVVLLVQGHLEQSVEYFEQALALYRQCGDEEGEYDVLSNLVSPYLSLGKGREAGVFLQQIHARACRVGDRPAEQIVLVQMGLAAMGRRQTAQALDHLEHASKIAQERGDRRGDTFILWNLAICQEELGNRHKALELAQKAVDISREFQLPTAERYAESLERFRSGDIPLESNSTGESGYDSRSTWLFDEPLDVGLSTSVGTESQAPANLLRMAYTATRSMAKFASSGFKTVSRDARQERLDICRGCHQHTGLRCKICGCFTAPKTWLRHEGCPLDKW